MIFGTLKERELAESDRLRKVKVEKEIEKQTEYTKKRNQVLDNLTPMGKLSSIKTSSIKVDKELRKRRIEIFIRMYNASLTREQVKESEYIKRMFSGEKIDGVTFDQAIEKVKKSDTIKAKIIDQSSKNFSKWDSLGAGFKKALGFGKNNKKCPICKNQLSNKEKKRNKHLQKCNGKMQSKKSKHEKKFVQNIRHTSFSNNVRSRYYHDLEDSDNYRRGSMSGGIM